MPIAIPYRTTSVSSRLRIFGSWRELGIFRRLEKRCDPHMSDQPTIDLAFLAGEDTQRACDDA